MDVGGASEDRPDAEAASASGTRRLDARTSLRPTPGARAASSTGHQDDDDHRKALPRILGISLIGWSSFYALDLYSALVLHAEGGVAWFTLWRAVGVVTMLGAIAATRAPTTTIRRALWAEIVVYWTDALCIALMAVRHGGLNSHYLHGISVLMVMWVLGVPSRGRRAFAISSVPMVVFPIVMAFAAIASPIIRAQWSSPASVALFVHDYVFLVATAVLGAVASDLLWSSRRQVYEARKLGRYRLKARIGQGGMGEVWLALDDRLGRDVALKILPPQHSTREGAIARFEREARATSRLASPHTVRVFDYGASDDGVWFIAMEHLVGIDLATLVATHGPLPAARAAYCARQACRSLAEAHAAGIIHRDVKPGNLFVTTIEGDPDFVKLLDFGIARLVRTDDDATMTQGGWVGGTPAFMSPEVCAGKEATPASDVYSLGATLYCLLTGSPPFADGNFAALMAAHLSIPPTPPSERLRAAVPAAIEAIVLRCLEKRPEDRYRDIGEVERALAAYLRDDPWSPTDARDAWGPPSSLRASGSADTVMLRASSTAVGAPSPPPPR